ncbi:MAG: YeeE/YedE family protein [Candidatus Desulfofervidaceae bacterium]|nr:YeeE/YedE family protein [Candidatus Desulfofervidaceae bacterium]
MRITPAKVGFIVGFGAALGQALFKIIPPPAYGMCIACHVRDLVNWIIVKLFPIFYGGAFPGAPVSKTFPLLTIVGVLSGAFLAAKVNKEFRWKTMGITWQRPSIEFTWGMLVCIGALIMGGCPIRTTLKAAYLDITAMFGLVSLFIGVVLGCIVIRRLVKLTV